MRPEALHLVGMGRAADWAGMTHAGFDLRCVGDVAVVLASRSSGNAPSHHHHVLAACRRGPFLPARAGQIWTADAEASFATLDFQVSASARLALVDGCVELTLHMLLESPAEVLFVNAIGTSYLRHRQSELAAVAEVDARLMRAAELITRTVRFRSRSISQHSLPAPGQSGLMMAFLVDRSEGHRLAMDVEALARAALPDGEIRADGPWPPYHFAALAEPANSEAEAA